MTRMRLCNSRQGVLRLFRRGVFLGNLPELMTADMGIMYDPEDGDALRQAMLDIRQRDLQAMGERAHRRMLELSWERIAAQTLRAYQES